MKLVRATAEGIRTYLTVFSALVLPLLLVVWVRSYMVSDRYLHSNDGKVFVTSVTNGEIAVWTGPTATRQTVNEHRSRGAVLGWSTRRIFQRFASDNYVWLLGFGYGRSEQIPWRGLELTGSVAGVCIPMWFLGLLFGALPMRLLARNMQSSEEFLAQRAAEAEAAAERSATTNSSTAPAVSFTSSFSAIPASSARGTR